LKPKYGIVFAFVLTVFTVGTAVVFADNAGQETIVTTTVVQTTTTVPPTTQAKPPIPADAKCPQWWNLAREVGWAEEDLPMLDRIMWRESRCLPDAWNGHDAGLTQINQIHKEFVAVMGWTFPKDMFNPELSLRFTLKLWQGSGWRPWGF
jgi:hypothetical protein